MVPRAFSAALAVAALAGTAFGAKCTKDSHCPEDTPCYPLMSHSFDSCVPGPVCKSGTYSLDSMDDVQTIDKYLGDASKINWQSQGDPILYTDPATGKKSTLLTLAKGTSGSLLASTHYVWYGKICSKLTTAQGAGVVTAFILMSDVKDEIDFEWVGVDLDHVQSNYYSQGVTVYTNGKNLTIPGGQSTTNIHEYCIDWKEDSLTWSIDGDDIRTLERKETWNATAGRFAYPQTPSRVMLSLWPAGLPTNEKGTVDWAGGLIDWNSQYMTNGFYYANFHEVTVECYDPPGTAQKKGQKTYRYTDYAGTNNTVAITDDEVVLGSLAGTGEKPGEVVKGTESLAMVPGGNPGGGNRAEETGTSQSSNSEDPAAGPGTDNTFTQGGNAGTALEPGFGRIGGPAIAIVVAILGLIAL